MSNLIDSLATDAGAHVELAVFAHGVSVSLGPTIVTFDRILHAFHNRFLVLLDTLGFLHTRQQTQRRFRTIVWLPTCTTRCKIKSFLRLGERELDNNNKHTAKVPSPPHLCFLKNATTLVDATYHTLSSFPLMMLTAVLICRATSFLDSLSITK